jgi:hypothetical protein
MPKKKEPERRIATILKNKEEILERIEDMVTNGASLATMDAILKWPPNTLRELLNKGKEQKEGPYREFYMLFRSWAGEAKFVAEETLLKKSPEKYLDRSSTARIIDSEDDAQELLPGTTKTNIPGVEANKVLKAFEALAESGIDVNDALKKKVITVQPEEDEDGT